MANNTQSKRSFGDGLSRLIAKSVGFGALVHVACAEFVGSYGFVENCRDPRTLQTSIAAAALYGVYCAGECAVNYVARKLF